MSAGSIIIDLLMRTGSFDTDTDRSTKAAEKRFKELQKEAENLGKVIGASFAAAGAAALYFGKQVIDGLDALNDVADATGSSIENISALEDVALRTGTTLDNVSGILVKFNNVLKEADGKNAVSQALKAIGLDVAALKQLDPAEALRQAAVALTQFADDGNKARIVQELFGKSIKDAAPFLKDLAEQGELNAKATGDQTQAAEDFNKQLSAMQKNVLDVARSVTTAYLPALNDVLKTFNEKGLKSALDTFGNLAFDWEGNSQRKQLKLLQSDIESLSKDLAASGKSFRERLFGASSLGNIATDATAIAEQLDAKVAEYKKLQAAYYKLTTGVEGGRGKINPALVDPRESVGELPKTDNGEAAKRQAAFDRYLDGLNKQLERTKELSTVEQVLADIQQKRVEVISAAQKEQLIAVAKQVDAGKALEQQKKSEEESAKRLAAAQKQIADEVKGLYEATRTPVEQYSARLVRLNELLEAGRIDADLYRRAMNQANEDLVNATKSANEAVDAMSEFSKRAQQNIQDALGNTLEEAISGNFRNIGQMWLQLIQKMTAQALAARLNEALFGSSGNGFGDLLKGIFGGATGTGSGVGNAGYGDYKGFFDALPKMATGTNYVPYDGFVAALHEGEAIVPKKYNPAAGGAGMGTSFDFSGQTIVVGDGVSMGQVKAAVQAGNAQTEARIRRSLGQRGYA